MKSQKTVLILTASAGHGHKAAAAAYDYWLTRWGYRTQIIEAIPNTTDKIHQLLMLKTPKTYKSLFWTCNKPTIAKFLVDSLTKEVKSKIKQSLYRKPDIVISTYPLIHPPIGKLKFMLLLDPVVHATYCAPPLSHYYLAFWPSAVAQAKAHGIPEDRIIPTGPLVRAAFYDCAQKLATGTTKKAFKRQLGINPKTILGLVMAGSCWVDRTKPYLKHLQAAFTGSNILFVFICGKNRKFARHMSKKYRQTRIFKFVEWLDESQMATWMAAADFGLSFSLAQMAVEAGLARLPLYIFGLLEGQEEGYKDEIENRGVGLFLGGEPENQIKILHSLLSKTNQIFTPNLIKWQKELMITPQKVKNLLKRTIIRTSR